jgi:hypothetical protein
MIDNYRYNKGLWSFCREVVYVGRQLRCKMCFVFPILNQRDAQRSWYQRHPHYWRQYRQQHADYTERNRILQHHRDHRSRMPQAVKMDASKPLSLIKPGIYHLIPEVAAQDLAKMDVLSHKCHVIPIT